MATCKPHYLLFCDGCLIPSGALHTEARGRWRFVLEDIVTGAKSEASDLEPSDHLDRISLLAVTRGLEALEQPSRVTLITTSRYVARGLQYGLVEWREHDYCWEHFGSIQPIRNADLWRRVDVALRFHEVQCRWMSQESPFPEDSCHDITSVVTETIKDCVESLGPGVSRDNNERSALADEESYPGRSLSDQEEAIAIPIPMAFVATTVDPSCITIDDSAISGTSPISPSSPGFCERRMLTSGKRPIRWLWRLILAADAFLVSCLRCLLLLDPSRDQFRSRHF